MNGLPRLTVIIGSTRPGRVGAAAEEMLDELLRFQRLLQPAGAEPVPQFGGR